MHFSAALNLYNSTLRFFSLLWVESCPFATQHSQQTIPYSDYSGSDGVCTYAAANSLVVAVIAHCAAAAPSSRVVAAFVPQRRLFPCLLPHFCATSHEKVAI
jgi:hypothetical protein